MNPSFEPLSAEKILSVIDSRHYSRLTKLEILETIDSTNQYLLDHAKAGPSGWICLAEQQTAGRGRRGRAWFSARGTSIMCSMLWRFSKELPDVSGLSIAVGVMVTRALRNYGVQAGIQLKWPNDVLFTGRKLAGILLERRGENIVIGVGVNVNLPKSLDAGYIDLAEIVGRSITERNYLTGLILNELLKRLPEYQIQGLVAFIDEWRQHDFLTGKAVTISTPEKIIFGKVQGINEHGELVVLEETQTIQHFCYGEVSVRQVLP
jgi:BirA family transcriptional regulator, biotin operon repressor / biotin---[acetyl-CoA-carboxylase] ligase